MDEETFWRIIDAAAGEDDHEAALELALAKLDPLAIVAFQKHLDWVAGAADRPDIVGAADIVLGGCTGVGSTDDGFYYFRLWLVAMGRASYEKVMRDADALADFAEFGAGYEQLASIAERVYEAKTGRADYPDIWEATAEPRITEYAGKPVDVKSLWEPGYMAIERARLVYPRLCAWLVERGLDY